MTIEFLPSPEQGIRDVLKRVYSKLADSGKEIQTALRTTTQRHFQTIYPGSNHYDPSKVTDKDYNIGDNPSGSVNINVPGITRAYHDIHISPVNRGALTIPIHQEAYGKKAGDFNDLFLVKKNNGKAFLARKNGQEGITFMYFLAQNVNQPRDNRLMPSNETFGKNIFARIKAALLRN